MSQNANSKIQKKSGNLYIYVPLIIIAAGLSQTAEWVHIKFADSWGIWEAYGVSMLLAALEYTFSVPANRIGTQVLYPDQLQIIWISLQIFFYSILLVWYFDKKLTWQNWVGYGLIIVAVILILRE